MKMIPMKKQWLNRRTFLRCAAGGAGTMIAMPPLEAMFRSDTAFAQAGTDKPKFLAIYQPNGHHPRKFHPTGGPRNLTFGAQAAAPLEPWMQHITIMKDMVGSHMMSDAMSNPHLIAIVSWLTGSPVPSAKSLTHKISADTYVAQHYDATAPTGKSQHLVISGSPFLDPGGGYNNEQKDWVSSAANGEKIFATISLKDIVDDIFTGADPQVSDEQRKQRHAFDQSVLDFAMEDIGRIEARLGVADKATLGGYLENVRLMEQRLSAPLAAAPMLNVDPAQFKFSRDWPKERADDLKNEFIDEHWKDTMQVLRVAFQADIIRSVSYMLETEAGESGYANHGLPNSHGTSHGINDAYSQRDRMHGEIFVEMLKLFQDTPYAATNLLENTMIMWGAGIGESHSRDQQMAILAGYKGNGINHGALRDLKNTGSAIPLMRTLLLHMGVLKETESFGDAGPNDLIDLTS
ncbi:MAG: hypothetical protein RJA70_1534 [Pseudomonadota bacterium]|jgi:hypothetical protein